ncbi:hypothetical protein KQY27_02825 [Methanobrevibacter sp. TMH8]|uniref:hypothetical protein n=1 Tax=Methanobrevibacter sp. TMH8 TaxID=2848611 RepID=UPI001CCA8ABF|nr:hypothetical protein [Methanobrevibacter sp. TMH8]MBZ9570478.1 hypothetical protein [Methanobrevibacter sp. TMH8]
MEFSKNFAAVISILFFFAIAGMFFFITSNFFPEFSFYNNPVIRLIAILVLMVVARLFYNYLKKYAYDENEEQNNKKEN